MNGHLEASTAVRVSSLVHHALDERGLEGYSAQTGRPEAPSALVEDLLAALTTGIDELTRPVDAIKHQAKTVTVGTSRTEDDLYHGRLAASVLDAGVPRPRVSFRALRSLAALEPAFVSVDGYTRYEITGDVAADAVLRVVAKGGVAVQLTSRTGTDPRLRGTKHRAAHEREVTVARGHDGRLVVLVPETAGGDAVGLILLHVTPAQRLEPRVAREVLSGHRNRYAAIVDAVTETQRAFDDHVLGSLDPAELLTQPVAVLARHWHSPPEAP
jgi:glucosamine--fructose-6-phosphate aminotransferase (isomerizing)